MVGAEVIIACVKHGDKYDARYVNALARGVARNLAAPHDFVCFTENPAGLDPAVTVRDLPPDVFGWWSKLALFALLRDTPVVFFDLDTIIVGDITPLAEYAQRPGSFAMLRDFYYPQRLASGVMAWNGDYARIYGQWLDDGRPQVRGGDQAFIESVMKKADIVQDILPGAISYKAHRCDKRYPADARVICFHGEPKPHNCGAEWVRQEWS
jgi:hypothetical protein